MFSYDSVFPVNKHTKKPLTPHGFKDASSDPAVIDKWTEMFPDCGWGFPTGDGVFVIDVDKKSGGLESWNTLTDLYGVPNTYTVQTMNGGLHAYFAMPTGTVVKNSTGKFAQGIDTRGEGGYVVIPMDNPAYKVINNADVSYPPVWVLERLEMTFPKQYFKSASFNLPEKIGDGERNSTLFTYGCSLQARGRSDEEIAQALDEANQEKCNPPLDDRELSTILSQVMNYEKGTPRFEIKTDGVRTAGKNTIAKEYLQAMIQMGYSFRLNVLDDVVYINGKRMSDVLMQELLFNLDNYGFNSKEKAEKAWVWEAKQHEYHPIHDYLTGLKWDGRDHIGELASYFVDNDNVFHIWLRKWLIGAVAKVLPYPKGVQNRTLVLVGDQNTGKSFFARWLASGVPECHVERGIDPESKDDRIRRATAWVWEVGELGAVTRLKDREQLKTFQSEEWITERLPYAHYPIRKPHLANYIGTINDEGNGFLNDPTGNRRYMVCNIKSIDWNYARDIDVNQVWAQAVALLEQGESWNLSGKEVDMANEINAEYEVETPMSQYIAKFFDVDTTELEWIMPTNEIVEVMRKHGVISVSDRSAETQVGKVLRKRHVLKKRVKLPNYSDRVYVWYGIKVKKEYELLDQVMNNIYNK